MPRPAGQRESRHKAAWFTSTGEFNEIKLLPARDAAGCGWGTCPLHYGPGPMPHPRTGRTAGRAANPAVELRAGVDRLLAFLGGEPSRQHRRWLSFSISEIAPFFDFEYMASSAGGAFRTARQRRSAGVGGGDQAELPDQDGGRSLAYHEPAGAVPAARAMTGKTAQVARCSIQGSYLLPASISGSAPGRQMAVS